jgi:hypothetical protein
VAEDGDGATPELGLEGNAGGVGGSAPERGLEGDNDGVDEEAPEVGPTGAVDAAGAATPRGTTRGRRRRRHLFLCKRKAMLIKVHVPRHDDPMGHGIIAAIALGVIQVTKKDTRNGTGSEFVRGGGSNAGVTTTKIRRSS